jgi:ABC-type lipoprotein release transport system permease subunit
MAILAATGSALALSIVIGGIASLYPAVQVGHAEPYDTIRKGNV